MKSLNEFLVSVNNEYASGTGYMLFESYEIEHFTDIDEVYESILDKMLYGDISRINEALGIGKLFSKVGNKLGEWGDKITKKEDDVDKYIKDKFKKLSDGAKAAWKSAKEKAGEAWDKVKAAYTEVISAIDEALTKCKDTVVKFAEQCKVKAKELIAKVGAVTAALLTLSGKIAKSILELIKDAAKAPIYVNFVAATCLALMVGIPTNSLTKLISVTAQVFGSGKSEGE